MKQIPILFSTPMMQANLAGVKTETRRTRGLNEINLSPDNFSFSIVPKENATYAVCDRWSETTIIKCPYGKVGDQLWFRETWAHNPSEHLREGKPFVFRADYRDEDEHEDPIVKWKPNIHMPKAVCRMTAEITDIRIERLFDITHQSAIREGIYQVTKDKVATKFTTFGMNESWQDMSRTPLEAYMKLWDKINGKDSHLQNPWVWVIKYEFKTQLNS